MDTGLHTWLLLFFFCVCSTQGLAQNKGGMENLGEKGQVEQKPEVDKSEEEGHVQGKPEVQPEEKSQVLQKPEMRKPEEKGQVPQGPEIPKPEKKGQVSYKPEIEKPEEKGQVPQEPEIPKPGKKGQVPQKPEIEKPEEKGQVPQGPEIPKPGKKGQVPQKPEIEKPEEKGQVPQGPEIPKPEKKGQVPQKPEIEKPEEKGQVPQEPEIQKPWKKEPSGQVPQELEIQKPEKKVQVPQEPGMQKPEKKGQVAEKPDIQKPEEKGQVQRKPEMQKPEEKGQLVQKPAGQKPDEEGQLLQKPEVQKPREKGQVLQKPEMQKPEQKGQVPEKRDMQKPEEEGQVLQKPEMQNPEEKGQVPEKPDIQKPEEEGQVLQKPEMQKPEEKATAPHRRCLEKLKIGPCKAEKKRYYFNGEKCVKFMWGGCEPNGNNFKRRCSCEKKCLGRKVPCECYKPKKVGPCKAEIPRWWYNGRKCKKFLWGGCKPNGNNFKTKQECKQKCAGLIQQKAKMNTTEEKGLYIIILQKVEKDHSEGKGSTQQKAETSNSGGKGQEQSKVPGGKVEEKGKGGELPSECYEPKNVGRCRAAIPRWWYDGQRCQKFIWGGCNPNGNNFKTKQQCEEKCGAPPPNCVDPLKPGPCKAAIPRFWFDGRECKRFLWGGCAPNGNNFRTKLLCERTCIGKTPPHTCVGPRKRGPCPGAIRRWWFDGTKCKEFIYGGCAPNGNNYKSKEECEKTCAAPPPNCVDPLKTGPCKGAIPRFRFDGLQCRRFRWGGCFPNGNNFRTKLQCERMCIGRKLPRVCREPLKPGPCKAAIPRWWFNGYACLEFSWGGCAPNGNNFKTKPMCQRKCLGDRVSKPRIGAEEK